MHRNQLQLGAICLASLAASLAATGEKTDYIYGFESVSDTCVSIATIANPLSHTIQLAASLPKAGDNTKGEMHYSIQWITSGNRPIELRVTPITANLGTSFEQQQVRIDIFESSDLIETKTLTTGVAPGHRPNSLMIDSHNNRGLTIYFGKNTPKEILTLAPEYCIGHDVFLRSKGRINLQGMVYEGYEDRRSQLITKHTPQSIESTLHGGNADKYQGYWAFLDRETDDAYTHLGGRYNLAIIKSESGNGYDLIYLTGAETCATDWTTGMLKGTLTPTPFVDEFNLTWYDSEMNPHIDETSARFDEQQSILTLRFPLLKSQLRFFKMPKAKDR